MARRRSVLCGFSTILFFIAFVWAPLQGQVAKESITVFAAASLNDVFSAAALDFQRTNPDISISFNFAGSQQLVQQIAEGAPADIFASANIPQMQKAAGTGRIDSTGEKIFAHNFLIVITPANLSMKISAVRDLASSGLKIVLADKAVPVGHYTLEFLDQCNRDGAYGPDFKEKVLRNVVSYEENVRAVLSKVELGECDAGVVYTTDAASDTLHRISTIKIPDKLNLIADYPLALLNDSKHREAAEKFVHYILSDAGRALLKRYGFIPPSPVAAH